MNRIALLASPCIKSFNFLFPFRVFREDLKKHGIEFEIQSQTKYSALTKFDEIWIFESDYRSLLQVGKRNREGALQMLERFKQAGKKIRWIDNSDSSGCLRSYVLPFVDSYIKSQVLIPLTEYLARTTTGVGFRDYFSRKYELADSSTAAKASPSQQELAKIQVGWNLGMSDWGARATHGRCSGWVSRIMGRPYYPIDRRLAYACHRFSSSQYRLDTESIPLLQRSVHIHCRAGKYDSSSVNAHRKEVQEIVSRTGQQHSLRVAAEGWVTRTQFLEELSDSVIVVSPFGWGEICYRDFECFLVGAVLLKPDMNHIKTWPAYYEPNVTYIPFAWDLSDLEQRILETLADVEHCQAVAANGQRRFLESLSARGGDCFAALISGLTVSESNNSPL